MAALLLSACASNGSGSNRTGAAGSAGAAGSSGAAGSASQTTGAAGNGAAGRFDADGSAGTSPADGSSSGAGAKGGFDGAVAEAGCAGYVCVPSVPAGWSGPFQVKAAQMASAGTCPNPNLAYFEGHQAVSTEHLNCGACTCIQTPILGCKRDVVAWSGSDCTGTSVTGSVTDVCGTLSLSSPQTVSSVSFGAAQPMGTPSCAPPTTPTAPPLNQPAIWQDDAIGCAASAPRDGPTGCAGGAACVQLLQAPFSADLCIAQIGDNACPAAFPSKTRYYTSAADSRACGPCACTPFGTLTCTAGGLGGTQGACANSTYGSAQPGCINLLGMSVQLTGFTFMNEAACQASGGGSSGDVTPQNPLTVCCVHP
jgi:hypothetical protein